MQVTTTLFLLLHLFIFSRHVVNFRIVFTVAASVGYALSTVVFGRGLDVRG